MNKKLSGSLMTVDLLRSKYGYRESFWGDWSCQQTRRFYKDMLPLCLQQIEAHHSDRGRVDSGKDDTCLILLEEKAYLAAQTRIALRLYSRERCILPGRLAAEVYDGVRHLSDFGQWSTKGMSWEQLKDKYWLEAQIRLGPSTSTDSLLRYTYGRIIDRSSRSNGIIDTIADENSGRGTIRRILLAMLKEQLRVALSLTGKKWGKKTSSLVTSTNLKSPGTNESMKNSGTIAPIVCDVDDDEDCTVCIDLDEIEESSLV
jgi:hypothetical protein